jgi:hypothetical protein
MCKKHRPLESIKNVSVQIKAENKCVTHGIEFDTMGDRFRSTNDAARVVFQEWRWPLLQCPSKTISINK